MANNNDGMNEFIIGGVIVAMIAIALMVAGVVVALIAVAGFVINEWRKIYRYEGKQPVLWLAGITAVLALPCIGGALEQFRLFAFYLERQNQGDLVLRHALSAIAFIVALAVPTGAYWFYRLVQPISHIRVNLIEMFHDQYRRGDITRRERDTQIEKTIATGDDELERMVAESRRQKQQPAARPIGAAFDIPDQD